MTGFYAPLMPLCLIISIIGLFILYLIDKYTIINNCTIKRNINKNLSIQMTEILEWYIPVFCVS